MFSRIFLAGTETNFRVKLEQVGLREVLQWWGRTDKNILPSPRARVCILRCVRVRVALNIPDRDLFRLVHPGYGRILFCPRLPPCLPFVLSSLPSTPLVPVLPSSVFLSLPTAVGFLLFFASELLLRHVFHFRPRI